MEEVPGKWFIVELSNKYIMPSPDYKLRTPVFRTIYGMTASRKPGHLHH